ncbi:putative GTP diphosphokinase RSH1, chloroplastic [Cocos nucifera]|nr:putative GTP diphosphokinase RSH1, chloroplastic [Cocos nucifera]
MVAACKNSQCQTQNYEETVNNFVADLEDESDYEQTFSSSPTKERDSKWEKILMNIEEASSTKQKQDLLHVQDIVGISKINGKHNKSMQKLNFKVNGNSVIQGNGFAEFLHANIPTYKEVLPSLESWKDGKIASWHNVEGRAIQWFCVVCIDRKGMMAEVTSALTATGITICSCVAEIDRRKGMGVMLFHYEGTYHSLVQACSGVDVILGVLGWSAGCSWSSPLDNRNFLEC